MHFISAVYVNKAFEKFHAHSFRRKVGRTLGVIGVPIFLDSPLGLALDYWGETVDGAAKILLRVRARHPPEIARRAPNHP